MFLEKEALVFPYYEFIQITSHVAVGEVSALTYCCVPSQKDTVGDYIYIYICVCVCVFLCHPLLHSLFIVLSSSLNQLA